MRKRKPTDDCQCMPVQVLAATPRGDVPLNSQAAAQLPPAGPGERSSEATLTYGSYLEAVSRFFLRDSCKQVVSALGKRLGRPVRLAEIEGITICAEKHGAFYHVVRVDLRVRGVVLSFGVNVATNEAAKVALMREYRLLKRLARCCQPSFLPQVYWRGAELCRQPGRKAQWLHMLVVEWLSEHYEFHLHRGDLDSTARLLLWDSANGYRCLNDFQSIEIYRQAARILTLYYSWNSFKQIYPWHHAAGDFVAKFAEGERIDLRLITVRDYGAVVPFKTRKVSGRLLALILFFLHLTVQMRLDRLDGVGEVVWAENVWLAGTVRGFLEAAAGWEEMGRRDIPSNRELQGLLCRFTRKEWGQLLREMLETYHFSQEELHLIRMHGDAHLESLHQELATLSSEVNS
jgi:hypothetical protein